MCALLPTEPGCVGTFHILHCPMRAFGTFVSQDLFGFIKEKEGLFCSFGVDARSCVFSQVG